MEREKARAWIELDLEALERNFFRLRALLPPGCALMPVLKADAYGHGALPLALRLQRLGARAFCVATAEEGAALRQGGVRGELLVLGATQESLLPLAAENRLLLTVPDLDAARRMDARGLPLRAHLAIDTGMRRIGERAEATERLEAACRCKNLRIEGAFTHLCTEDRAFSRRQGERFWAAVAALRARGIPLAKPHLLNSYGLLHCPELGGAYARAGLALYGYAGEGEAAGLEPVLALKARLGPVRTLQRGESAGYGLRFQARRETRLALLPIGYADGLPRSLSEGRGGALVRGRFAPFAGLLCMDQCLLDVTDIPGAAPGDEAVLIGVSGPARQDAWALARAAGTIPNELLSRLGPRLPRLILPASCGLEKRMV